MRKESAFRLQLPFLAVVVALLILYAWMMVALVKKIERIKSDAQEKSEKTKQKVNLRSKQ